MAKTKKMRCPKVMLCHKCGRNMKDWSVLSLYVFVNGEVVEKEISFCREHRIELEKLMKRQEAMVVTTFLPIDYIDWQKLRDGSYREKGKHVQVGEIKEK